MGLYKGSQLISPTQIVPVGTVTDPGVDAILTVENVINGGTKENATTVTNEAITKIQNFIDGDSNE